MATFSTGFELTGIELTGVELGRGSYATILQLDYRGLKCAGKRIHDALLSEEGISYALTRFKEECEILNCTRHPNIVQFLGVFHPKEETVPILVMEFLPTDLDSCIKEHGILPKDISYSILHDIALGLHHLHAQCDPIYHRDLSSNNILLTNSWTAKIGDLGMARILPNLSPIKARNLTGVPGTIAFMPPEAMVDNPEYNSTIDIFSYGIIMVHILSGKRPEPHVQPTRVESGTRKLIAVSEAQRRQKYLEIIGNDHPLMKLTLKCINNDPQQRANIKEIITETSELVSKHPRSFPNPMVIKSYLEADDEDTKALRLVGEERAKIVQHQENSHATTIKELQEQLEHLRIPLTTTKQPIQASISWTKCSQPPTALSPAQSVVINNNVYFRGSETDYNKYIYCYNRSEDKWTKLPPLPVKDCSLGEVKGMLVAVGGVILGKSDRTNNVYTLMSEKESQKWETKLPPMPTARSLAAVSSRESSLIVVGGQKDKGVSSDEIEVFKTGMSKWFKVDQILRLPTACYNLSLVASQNTIYIIGGQRDQIFRLNQTLSMAITQLLEVTEYDDVESGTDTLWKTCFNTPTHQPVATTLAGNVLAMGGWVNSTTNTTQTSVHMYHPQRNTWVYINDLPEPITWSIAASLSPTEILVVGGHDVATTVYKGTLTI